MYEANLNRSFARRVGKCLGKSKKDILEKYLDRFKYSSSVFDSNQHEKHALEIGFGMGEHFIHNVKLNPDTHFIGAEVYINGVADVLLALDLERNTNFSLWPDDVDLLFDKIPDRSLDMIYVLFPDPWPKHRQHKRRLMNEFRLRVMLQKLKIGGVLNFATDIEGYFKETLKLIESKEESLQIDRNFTKPHEEYVVTKYNKKAITDGREAQFLRATLMNRCR